MGRTIYDDVQNQQWGENIVMNYFTNEIIMKDIVNKWLISSK